MEVKVYRVMTIVTVENEKAISTQSTGLCVLFEVLNPFQVSLIFCPAVLSYCKNPVVWEKPVSLPARKVILACDDDEQRDTSPPSRTSPMDYYNPLLTLRLD